MLVNRTEWTDPSIGTASLNTQPSYPPAAAVSYGAKLDRDMAWGVGVGVAVPGGAQLTWPSGWVGREAVQSVSQQIYVLGVGGAFQPVRGVRIGASFLRYRAVEEDHQSINFLDHFGDAGVSISGGANAFGVGVEVRVPDLPLTLAATYKHSADVTLEGDAHFTNVPTPFQPMIHDQGISRRLTIPNEVFAGAAYEVFPNLKVMAAYSFERWSVYKADSFVGDDGFMLTVPRDDHNAHLLRFGGEWDPTSFAHALTLRIGGLHEWSGQPTDTLSPSLTDADKWAISAGAGYLLTPALRIDLGYQHAFFDAITATGTEAFPGTYHSRVDLVSLGVNWRIR
jgi:long-chain fatty acid transport protein